MSAEAKADRLHTDLLFLARAILGGRCPYPERLALKVLELDAWLRKGNVVPSSWDALPRARRKPERSNDVG